MGSLRGGVGAKPTARGSTPVPRPKLGDYSYILPYSSAQVPCWWIDQPELKFASFCYDG
jgi:hypothetical protein